MLKGKKMIILGMLVFVAMMLIMVFGAAPIQQKLGLYGVGITELMLLAIALLACLISRQKFKEVFPVKRVTGKAFGGSLLTWLGVYLCSLTTGILLLFLFPRMAEVAQAINSVMTSRDIVMAFIIGAVLPGICEECLHRGFLLSTFKGVQSVAVRVIAMGLLFGVFHLDLYRFLPTMLLGMGLTYIMIKTQNILLPIFFHFFNNFISVISSFSMGQGSDFTASSTAFSEAMPILSLIGMVVLYASIAAICLYYGMGKLNKVERTAARKRRNLIVTLVCCGVLVCGFIMYIAGIMMNLQDFMPAFSSEAVQISAIIR